MIHIFFTPGMFGSTVEYVLRNFTKEFTPVSASIAPDGSMHTFRKMNHPTTHTGLQGTTLSDINTPTYPFKNLHLPDILEQYPIKPKDFCTLIYAKSFEDAELNILFQYHKIATGNLNVGIKIFYGQLDPVIVKSVVSRWNQDYSNYTDFQPWEFREWFSIFYPTWVSEWQDSYNQVPNSWLKISSLEILKDTKNTFEKIINFCNLSIKDGLEDFVTRWQSAQQYIEDQYILLDQIVANTIDQRPFKWQSLPIVAEAMIQKKLRDKDFEIRCDGLNIFPMDSESLYNLLYKV